MYKRQVILLLRDQGQAQPRIAGRAFHQRIARADFAGTLGALDHG
ncbi:hypothetical protein [Dyella sp. ASV21]|nr:hypothetical protein [Dyella sp. ASV21]